MEKQKRTGYAGAGYPTRALDRRSFLTRLGAATGLVLISGLNVAGRGGRAAILTLRDGTYLVTLPSSGDPRPLYVGDSLSYLLRITVAAEDLAYYLVDEEAGILPHADAALQGYSVNALTDPARLPGIGAELLQLLIDYCEGDLPAGDDDDSAAGDDDSVAGDDDSAAGDDDSAGGEPYPWPAVGECPFAASDFISVALVVTIGEEPTPGDDWASGGCSCSSVPWHGRG